MNRLPPETLSRIARFVGEHATDARPIIPLTHVCRYWRESIVSTPGNWTLISNEWIRLMELSLGRCQAAPLELQLSMAQIEEIPRFTALITPYMKNMESLIISNLSTIGRLVQALPNFPQSMPNLRILSLSINPSVDRLEDVSADGPLGGPTPALTHLSLFFVPLYPSLQHLTTLTNLTLRHHEFDLHIHTLLDFLEANRALEYADLGVVFARPALWDSRRQVGIVNRLKILTICSTNAAEINALISRMPLQKGAHLQIILCDKHAGLSEVLSGISVTHLSNLQSPTSMEYHPDHRRIQLVGPNGGFKFWFNCVPHRKLLFVEFPLLQLTSIKTFRLVRRAPGPMKPHTNLPQMTFPLLALRALETLAIEHEVAVPHLLSALFADPSVSPSLKTLAFLNCHLDGACMEALTKFASDRKNTTSAWLYRVVIVSSGRALPNFVSVDALGEHVPVVNVQMGKKLPADLFEPTVGGLACAVQIIS